MARRTLRAEFRFAPGLGVGITADAPTLRHFAAEYGPAAAVDAGTAPAAVEVSFVRSSEGSRDRAVLGGHKTVHWAVTLGAPEAPVIAASIAVGGWPQSFALSLVQGYFVEPLISVAAATSGRVLLPAAGFVLPRGAAVALGGSGTGKTTLAAYALAAGVPVLGDDQVLIDRDGACLPFPRRLRLYSDLAQRVPLAYGKLSRRTRLALAARRVARTLSRGAVAPPLPLAASVLGGGVPVGPARIGRIVMLERPTAAGGLLETRADASDAVAEALRLLRGQRDHLARTAGEAWREAIAALEDRERAVLQAAFAGGSVERIRMPFPLAGDAIASVGAAVGFEQVQPARAE